MMNFTSGISITKDIFQFLNFLKGIVGSDVISAYFRYDATRVKGSSKIKVKLHTTETNEVFWFTVKPIEDYIFIRFPLNDSGCEERIACVNDEILPDPNYWRWVQAARTGTIVNGTHEPANAKVDFIVVGYKPKAIIKHLSRNA